MYQSIVLRAFVYERLVKFRPISRFLEIFGLPR